MSGQGLPTKNPIFASSRGSQLPAGSTTGDILYWDHTEKNWVKLDAPDPEGTWVLGVVDGVLQWIEGDDDC